MDTAVNGPLARLTLAEQAGEAFLWACAWDVAVRKPGNVSQASAGHRMQAAQFLASAQACAAALAAAGQPVGRRIEVAVAATQQAVGCNTNLGIVLLCAPLAAAHELAGQAPGAGGPVQRLRQAWQRAMDGLTVADAAAAFRAIAQARPAGLGQAAEQDVRQPPQVSLGQAMALAAGRDRVAAQYGNGAQALFETGLAALRHQPAAACKALLDSPTPTATEAVEDDRARLVQAVYLALLAGEPDSHIVRKHGSALAHSVMREALPWAKRSRAGETLGRDPAFAAWDESLKARGLNPGSTADLTVATLMAARLSRGPGGALASAGSAAG